MIDKNTDEINYNINFKNGDYNFKSKIQFKNNPLQIKIFDYKKTPSNCGSLSNIALQRSDFKRTKHPIHSFAVFGKHKNYLCNLENKSSWGEDSPFKFLYKNSKN